MLKVHCTINASGMDFLLSSGYMASNLFRLVEIPIMLNQEIAFCRNQSLGVAAMHLEILMAHFTLLFMLLKLVWLYM